MIIRAGCRPCFRTSGNSRCDEARLLPEQTEAMSGSKSHRLQHSARHHAPHLGFNTLQAGRRKTEKEILRRKSLTRCH